MAEANKNVRIKKAGLLTKIVICILVIYLAMTLLSLRSRINATHDEVEGLTVQVEDQIQRNTELANDIENSSDPSHIRDVAREKLDLAEPNERVFYITD